MNDYHFLPKEKYVIDKTEFLVYKISDFKKMINEKIKEENEYQFSIDKQIIDAKQKPPFKMSEVQLGFFDGCIESSEKRIKNYKRLLTRCVIVTNIQDGQNLARAKEVSISNFVDLNNFDKACCPFHKEKTPSFTYYRKDNRWWCYGACGEGGDVIDLVMKLNNVSLPEAIKICLNTH